MVTRSNRAAMLLCAVAALGAGRLPEAQPPPFPDADLLAAIERVESGGNPAAIGDGGLAVGVLQIHPLMVEDANRYAGPFTLADRRSPERSRLIFAAYAAHYSAGASREVIARRWNGGPHGERKPATARYWARVRAQLRGE